MLSTIGTHVKKYFGAYMLFLAVAVLSMSVYSAEAVVTRVYVTQNGAGIKDGSSWGNAMGETEFASALSAPVSEMEFWVAGGAYRPSVTGDTGKSFQVGYGTSIYGGFKGDETLLSQRDPYKYKTVLTGDLGNDDINKIDGITETAGNIAGSNSVTVVTVNGGSPSNTVIDGVIITAGNNAGGTSGIGGGMFIESGSPLVTNCTFAGNRSASRGAGLASNNWDAGPVITSCSFYGNTTLGNGGGVYSNSAPAETAATKITNCTFYGNTASQGGAAYLAASGVSVMNSTLVYNNAGTAGGGIYIEGGSSSVKNSIVWGNISPDGLSIKLGTATSASVSYSVVEGGFTGGAFIINEEPAIGAIDYNGGPTKTCVLMSDSPAINTGEATGAPAADQRGISRSGTPDIGSVEYSTVPISLYVDPAELNMTINELYTVTPRIFPTEAQGSAVFTWGSSDPTVVSVADGTITAHAEGQAVVSASSGGLTGTCLVTVAKITPVVYATPLANAIVYGQTLADSMLIGGSTDTDGYFAWKNGSIAPSVSDSEVTEYEAEFIPLDPDTYNRVTVNVSLVVNRAEMTYGSEGYSGEYDGAEHSISVAVTEPSTAVIMYGTESGTYDLPSPPLYREVNGKSGYPDGYVTYYRITDANYNTVTGSETVMISPVDAAVEVTEDTRTDTENSGSLTVGVNTAEDVYVYDMIGDMDAAGTLPAGIEVLANAIPAVSADIDTSTEIFTEEEIMDAINSYWNIEEASRDIALTVAVSNTVGTDAAYQETDDSLMAKAYRFITEVFTGRTGNTPGDSDYLPLEVNLTVTQEEIEKLPSSIKLGLGTHNFLERISVFALAHGSEGGADARSLYDLTESTDISRYTTVTLLPDGSYQVKTRFLVFNMPGGVDEGVGAPFIQPLAGTRNGSYYLFQDGIRDGYYDLCTILAVKTLKGRLNVTITGDMDPLSADWTVTGSEHTDPVERTGEASVLLEKDTWNITFGEYDGYYFMPIGDLEKDLQWEEDWNFQGSYTIVPVTAISSDILPLETLKLRMNVEGGDTHQLHAEVVPANALNKTIIWTSSDPEKISVDQTGLVTALELCEDSVTITAETEDGGYTAIQPVTATNIVKGISIAQETATIRVAGDPLSLDVTVMPEDATDQTVNWISSNLSAALVDSDGVVTAVAPGTAIIQGTAADGDGSAACTDTCIVTVLPAFIHVTGVSVDPATLTLNTGYSRTVTAVVLPDNATDPSVTWSSDNASVATVSSGGRITAVSAGSAVITATSTDGEKRGVCTVTVNRIPQPVIPELPTDTPESVRTEVRPVEAEFSEDKTAVLERFKEGIITPENLVLDPTTGLVQIKDDLAVELFNGKDIYKPISADAVTELPVFAAGVEPGKTAMVGFKVMGSELFTTDPGKIMVLKVLGDTESEFFTYAASSAAFATGKYTLQTADNPLYTGAIDANTEYLLVLFIKDGSIFDLDGTVNGEVVDPAVIVKAEKKDPPTPPVPPTPGPDDGGGGCSTTLPLQMIFLAIPFIFRYGKKK